MLMARNLSNEVAAGQLLLKKVTTGVAASITRAYASLLSDTQYAEVLEWAVWMRLNLGRSPRTLENYVDAVVGYLIWINGQHIATGEVRSTHVDLWVRALFIEHKLSEATRILKLTAVRQYYEWRTAHHGGNNPTTAVRGPSRDERVPIRYSRPQLEKIFATCDHTTVIGRRDYSILVFVYSTGARSIEVERCSLPDLVMQKTLGAVKFHGKGSKERVISFKGEPVKALGDWLADRENIHTDHDATWVSLTGPHKGERLKTGGLWRVIKRALKKAGLNKISGEAGLHRLRSSYATEMYDQTKDIKLVKSLLGHKKIDTTEKYIAISDTRLKTHLDESNINELTGGRHEPPLWLRQKQ